MWFVKSKLLLGVIPIETTLVLQNSFNFCNLMLFGNPKTGGLRPIDIKLKLEISFDIDTVCVVTHIQYFTKI